MRPGVSWGVLGYPGVSWGNQTDPPASTASTASPFTTFIHIYQDVGGIRLQKYLA